MFQSTDVFDLVRNFTIYLAGVAAAVAGALGLAEALELSMVLSALLFVVGLVIVISVHEYLDGPI